MSEEVKQKKQLSPKTKKIINIVVDVVVAIVLVFAVFLAVVSIRSKLKGYSGYTEIFGTAYVAVASDSMDAELPDYVPEGKPSGFAKGDLIKLRLIDESEAVKLEVGDIISFESSDIEEGKTVLNTHRIVAIAVGEEGNAASYITRGDANDANDRLSVLASEIVGVYEGKAPGIGHVFLFMSTSTGFFVCIVLPTLLIVAYCVVNLILVIRREKKVQTADAAAEKEAEKERIRQEILAEMQSSQSSQDSQNSQNAQPEALAVEENKEEPQDKGE